MLQVVRIRVSLKVINVHAEKSLVPRPDLACFYRESLGKWSTQNQNSWTTKSYYGFTHILLPCNSPQLSELLREELHDSQSKTPAKASCLQVGPSLHPEHAASRIQRD